MPPALARAYRGCMSAHIRLAPQTLAMKVLRCTLSRGAYPSHVAGSTMGRICAYLGLVDTLCATVVYELCCRTHQIPGQADP
jgi:hypothetical protein